MSSHSTWRAALAARLAEWKTVLLLIGGLLVLLLAVPASRLKLDESIESFYTPDDPFLLAYQESKRTFGGDEFVMVAYQADDPTSQDELLKIREFSDELSAVPGVRPESTQDLDDILNNPRASLQMRIYLRIINRKLLELSRRVLIGDDGQTTAIVLRLQDEAESPVSRTETFRRIRQLADAHDPPAFVAGEPIQVHDMFRYVEDDGWLLGLASSGLLMFVILLFFRNLRWVFLPIAVIHVTLIWTKGALFLSGMQLSMVSSMLTSLITIIGIATVMHVTVTYRELRETLTRTEAWAGTVERLVGPIFWTCLTTAIGFASLLSSGITPVRSFGIMMSLGTLLVPLACLLILPAGVLLGNWQADPRHPWGEDWARRRLRGLAVSAVRWKWAVLTCALALSSVAGWGLSRLTVETDFSKNFLEESPIVQSLRFFEDRLGGVGSWEIAFDAPEELSPDYLDRIRNLVDELRQLQLPDGTKLTKVVALTDGLDPIPGLLARRIEDKLTYVDQLQPEMRPSLYNRESQRMRIMLRALEQQPAEVKLRLIDAVEKTARQHFPEAQATGLYVLLAYLISSLLRDQLVSFALAALGVTVTMSVAFRSLRVGVISLVPNVLPILLVIGGMGFTGMPINIGTAMIASVSMGLTVDSTIHYLTAYDRARGQGNNHLEAVQIAHGSVGLTLTLANIALVIGFSVLSLSHFVPLIYFGVLVSVAMLGGLIGNLLLLPVLLFVRGNHGVVATAQGSLLVEKSVDQNASESAPPESSSED